MTPFWSDTVWYECDSMEEYELELAAAQAGHESRAAKYHVAKARNGELPDYSWKGEDWNTQFVYHNWRFDKNVKVNEKPRNRCSDGWHYSEGKYIEGDGFYYYEVRERSSKTVYILKPGAKVRENDQEEWIG